MDEAVDVRVMDGVADLDEESDFLFGGELGCVLGDGDRVLDEFEDEVWAARGAVGPDAGVVDGDDAGVGEACEDFGFGGEALGGIGVVESGAENLDGDAPARLELHGLVDDGMGAVGDAPEDGEAGDDVVRDVELGIGAWCVIVGDIPVILTDGPEESFGFLTG